MTSNSLIVSFIEKSMLVCSKKILSPCVQINLDINCNHKGCDPISYVHPYLSLSYYSLKTDALFFQKYKDKMFSAVVVNMQ